MSTPTSFLTEEMRLGAIGSEGPSMTVEVEIGAIVKFAQAIDDPNTLWNDEATARKSMYGGLIAPPTFLRCLRPTSPKLPFDLPFDRVLDGGSSWEYFEPVRPNDRITAVDRIEDMQERSGRIGLMIITNSKITYHNQFNALVATQTTTVIRY